MRNERDGDFTLDEPLPLGATEPVDVVQVRADDALVAALGSADEPQNGTMRIDDPIDERLAGLLRSWRDDVRAEPDPLMVTEGKDIVGAALAAVTAAPRVRRQSRSANPFGPLATAAAVLVIAFIGLGLAARGAEPGDPLWNVTKVLYSEKARSVEAKVTVQAKLDQASKALQTGNIAAAVVAIQEARQQLPVVAAEDGRQELATQADLLLAEVVGTTPPTVPESTPPAATSTTTESTTQPSSTAVSTTEPPPTMSTTVPPSTTVPQPSTDTTPTGLPGESVPAGEPRSGGQQAPPAEPPAAGPASGGQDRRPTR